MAKLKHVWSLDISGTIRAGALSPQTSYAAYLVYKFEDEVGFNYRPSEVSIGVCDVELDQRFAVVVLEDEVSIEILPSNVEEDLKQHYGEALNNLPSNAEDDHLRLPDDYYLELQLLGCGA